jgi:hypothetical protein
MDHDLSRDLLELKAQFDTWRRTITRYLLAPRTAHGYYFMPSQGSKEL